jgi:type II secretory pathway component GspD/PulD (secretin)
VHVPYLSRSFTLKKFLVLIFITLLGNSAFAAETIIEVIPLTNRPAFEIVPLLAPLLGNTAQLIDNGSNLLVKTTPDRLAEIKAIVNQLDVRMNNLLISVIQSRSTTADELNAIARAQLNVSGDDPLKSGGRIIGHLYQTQDKSADESTETVRTLEGVPAHIKMGKAYPRQNFSAFGYPTTTEYTEATTGFAVIPRLAGQQVILSVSPWSDKINGRGQIEIQNAQSTLRVNLGEWVELGGVGESSNSHSNSALVNTRQIDKSQMHILVKVDRVN